MRFKEKKNKNDILVAMREILDRADREKRELTSSEEARYNELNDAYDKQTGRAPGLNNDDDDDFISGSPTFRKAEGLEQRGGVNRTMQPDSFRFWKDEKQSGARARFCRYLVYGNNGLDASEFRALQATVGAGSYLVSPTQMSNKVIMALEDAVFIRRFADVTYVPNAAGLTLPVLSEEPGDPTWTGELKIGNPDSDMDFEGRSLTPNPLSRYILVSKKLLRVSTLHPDDIVRKKLSYKFAVVEENAFLNGTGSNQPLGVFTGHDAGIPASSTYDISTHNTTTAIKADNLIEVAYSLKAQYLRRARWVFHRDALKQIRKLTCCAPSSSTPASLPGG